MDFHCKHSKASKQGAHGVARVISKRGYCSRSQAEKLVREGHVILRGKPVRDPESPAYENDEILVNGKPVTASDFVYFAMNKPRGIVTTASDEKGRKTVMDLFREEYAKMFPGKPMPHIAPVGRLDAASEGLLLFTNDTKWADSMLQARESRDSNIILSGPSASSSTFCHSGAEGDRIHKTQHLKIYRVQVKGKPSATELSQMEKGFNVAPRVFGEKKEFMHAERAVLHSDGEKNCWLEITLSEGKNREIRRMLAHLGYEVLRLMRIQFDKFKLEDLKPGKIKIIQSS
ncbi:pseudouridine synthase [Fibrobacter sp. UWH4]|uniref:pseudouridine synthase n=1 Tax=Fibrobacter sp. UWH4 TaxID=1896210 RepID=UPI00090ECED1|nr:pseudouridine synthase [Fibrobacter sp. UWH4]SHK51145.1 23S rRNA pseudouridine2605 synthase [Fibrobacter sp. UWH4]